MGCGYDERKVRNRKTLVMIYRNVPGIEGLQCNEDGKFRYRYKDKKVIYPRTVVGKKATARLMLGKQYYQASKLVAKTYKTGYTEDSFILYKDGDCHNISASNLIIGDRKEWRKYMMRNSVHNADKIDKRIKKLENVIKESSLTLHYFKTKDFEPINQHIQDYLYQCLMEYCLTSLHLGKRTAMEIIPDCIARMYECILNGMCLYNYERYCKKLLLNFKKQGNFGLQGSIPKPIEIEVQQLNLDCLCERFNVSKHKH